MIEAGVTFFNEIHFYHCLSLKLCTENWLCPIIHSLMVLEQLSTAIKTHVHIKYFILCYVVLIVSYHCKQRVHYYVMLTLILLSATINNNNVGIH